MLPEGFVVSVNHIATIIPAWEAFMLVSFVVDKLASLHKSRCTLLALESSHYWGKETMDGLNACGFCVRHIL